MLKTANTRLTTLSAFAFLVSIFAVSFMWSGPEPAPAHAAPNVTQRLTDLNYIRDLSYSAWVSQYDTLRMNHGYNWMDWSQDGCSSPSFASAYNDAYEHACLRHDFMWRTLAVADEATGRIWNERNRWVADKSFEDDATTGCIATYTESYQLSILNYCLNSAALFFVTLRSWKYDENLTGAETTSTDLRPTDYIQFPSANVVVDCGVAGSSNRCLPIHYIKLDGRPLSPQNIPYIAKDRLVTMDVIRANLQAPDGPPAYGHTGSTGELVLNVTWPLRADKTSSGATCPTDGSIGLPYVKSLDLDSDAYDPVNGEPSTLDKTLKRTPIYVTACAITTLSQEGDDLLDIRPRQASRNWITSDYDISIGSQIRHYENLKSKDCDGIPLTMSASEEAEVHGSWLGTDCVYDLRSQPYIDYYTFAVDQAANFTIDLEYQGDVVDTYLYLYQMVNGARSILALDDDGGDSTNSRISRTLDPVSFTIGVSTYYIGRSGDYGLHIRQAPSCSVIALPTTGTTANIYTTWISADCASTRRPGSYANYYSFTVDGVYSRQVTIDLTSVDADPFLYLIQGDSTAGIGYLEYDDNDGALNYDSQIIRTLLPGTYIIVATTYGGNETGAYTLSVTGHR